MLLASEPQGYRPGNVRNDRHFLMSTWDVDVAAPRAAVLLTAPGIHSDVEPAGRAAKREDAFDRSMGDTEDWRRPGRAEAAGACADEDACGGAVLMPADWSGAVTR